MFISKLSGNKTMKPIIFGNSCINLILGSKTDNNSNKTVNGVGKTLSLNLIDFCLGNNTPESLKKLEDWEFNLDIMIDNYKYDISRTINDHNNIFLNSQKKQRKNF